MMKPKQKLKVMEEIDIWQREREKYGPLKGGLRRFFYTGYE